MRSWWRRSRELSCQEMVGLVTEYLDGALSPRERRRFERHLQGCTDCPEYVEQIRAVVRAAKVADPTEPAPPSDDELRELFHIMRSE